MKTRSRYLIGAVFFLVFVLAWTQALALGAFPDFKLKAPADPDKAAYLGLDPGSDFKLSDIRAKVLLIEIFSMYCPHCQGAAKDVNRLYERIRGSAHKGDLKMIGIGAGNSAFEVGVFQNKFAIPMPLLPDEDYTVYDKLGDIGTPYFYLVRIKPGGVFDILFEHQGPYKDEDAFFKTIIQKSGF
ncbi:MAG: TlpA disulfide reductase family protein [Thermodesulfobacteriota bacterium]|nr:TlpA disulfide reductase family protein [Thermodesulfobacteriota bacterium]